MPRSNKIICYENSYIRTFLYFDVWDIYNALDKGQQLCTYVLHCLYIYILAVYRKSMSRISSNRKSTPRSP